MKQAFINLDITIRRDLFGDKKITILDIQQIQLENFTYLRLAGLFYTIGIELTKKLIARRYTKKSIDFETNTIQDIAFGIINNPPSLKRQTISKALRVRVWDMHLDPNAFKGLCMCCSTNITRNNFQSGHIISVVNGGESKLNNLKPICSTCNQSMGTENLEDFIISCGFDKSDDQESSGSSGSVQQCQGITKKGNRCKNKTHYELCQIHSKSSSSNDDTS